MLYIKEKQLDIVLEFVDIFAGDQMQPWFVALNPNHSVAYVVMAYIVMACILTAYIVMAYIVMAYI